MAFEVAGLRFVPAVNYTWRNLAIGASLNTWEGVNLVTVGLFLGPVHFCLGVSRTSPSGK